MTGLATMIHERRMSGLVIGLERSGKRWELPFDIGRADGETYWALYDTIFAGDRLSLPDTSLHQVLCMRVRGVCRPGVFRELVDPWPTGYLAVLTQLECPACGTKAGHPIDLPVITDWWWVARTCITCGHSWQQEVDL